MVLGFDWDFLGGTFAKGFPTTNQQQTEKLAVPRKRGRPPGSKNKALKMQRDGWLIKTSNEVVEDKKVDSPKSAPMTRHETKPSLT